MFMAGENDTEERVKNSSSQEKGRQKFTVQKSGRGGRHPNYAAARTLKVTLTLC